MTREQLEQTYQANGLTSYEIHNEQELLKVHGINLSGVKGYANLSEENKKLYKAWFLLYLNRQGMNTRLTLIPTAAYVCEEVHFDHVYTENGEKYAESVKTELWEVAANGQKHLFKSYKGSKATKNLEINQESTSEPYLRVEIKERNKNEWYHVYSLSNWG